MGNYKETPIESRKDSDKKHLPRERLTYHGIQFLCDYELIALILRSGVQGRNILSLASKVVDLLDSKNYSCTLSELEEVKGLGKVKAGIIIAVIELARRIHAPKHHKIRMPLDILPLVQHYADRKKEYFLCITLNGAYEVITVRVVSIGLLNQTLVHPREVFAEALTDRAAAIIVAHNHPSGNIEPSKEDKAITKRLAEAGQTLGIRLLDHVIFSVRGHYSFCEKNEL